MLHPGCMPVRRMAFAQMEVRKFAGGPGDGEPIVVRTCIAAVPRGYTRLEISQVDDPVWGGDGWDT